MPKSPEIQNAKIGIRLAIIRNIQKIQPQKQKKKKRENKDSVEPI
jgi:hypothetical protein